MQEEGGRGSRVIYSVLNSCRDKSTVKPQNKALSPALAERKTKQKKKCMRKRVFANDDLPLARRDRETVPGRGRKDSNFQREEFQKK